LAGPEPVFDALGRRFVVRCVDPEVQAHAWEILDGLQVDVAPDGVKPRGDIAILTIDLAAATPAAAIVALMGTINLWAVVASEGKLLLHAGAVTDGNGAATVLCGPSGSGKSTLTTALTQQGLGYITDEAVCLDAETMRITPFRKPLSIKPGSYPALRGFAPPPGSVAERCTGEQWLLPPQQLGAGPLPPGPLYPALVVFPTHVEGSEVRVERVRPAETAYLLGSNSVRLWWAAGGSLQAVARLARWAPAFRLTFGRTSDGVEAVEKLAAEVS
jgi:hypothetical protein